MTISDQKSKNSLMNKILASLLSLIFFATGSYVGYMMTVSLIKGIGVYSWEKVPCTITQSEVVHNDKYVFQVKYEYAYKDHIYSSDRYAFGKYSSDKYAKVNELASQYTSGSAVECYVDPDEPGSAVIKRPNLYVHTVIFLFPLIVISVSGCLIYFIWKKKSEATSDIKTKKTKGKPVVAVLMIFFLTFALVGTVMLYFLTILPLYGLYCAKGWKEVPCQIISAKVRSHSNDDGETYSIDIFYKYQVAGKEYKSNTYDFFSSSSSEHNVKKAAVIDKYKTMENPVCYINPEYHNKSVLCRDMHKGYLIGLLPLPFILIGYGGVIIVTTNGRKDARGQSRKSLFFDNL